MPGKSTHQMQLAPHWPEIQRVVARGQASSIYCSIASVGVDGTPNVTPVGTVFLRDDLTGYYFDQYTSSLAENIESNPNICVMAVNSSAWFWFTSFLRGQFASPPGVRLYGKASGLRPATPEELRLIHARVRPTKWLKGSRLLWSDFTHVRDISFTSFRPVSYPKMTEGLWRAGA
jgi:hypothetical protein